ncbi:MAG TPA: response regulator transcription factor [Candidatus Obscuribacterales bacterium]
MHSESEITVLVVDDDSLLRIGLVTLLENEAGWNVVGQACDGEAACQLALRLKPRVVVMDLHMPGMNGIAATRRIKNALPNTKVVIVSASDDIEDIAEAISAGMDGYCLKSTNGRGLLRAIRTVVSGSAWVDPELAEKVLHAESLLHARTAGEDTTGGINLIIEDDSTALPSCSEAEDTRE